MPACANILLRNSFQFTPLREGRRCFSGGKMQCSDYFNSRPYVRGDIDKAILSVSTGIFQFTPLREGRLDGTFQPKGDDLFQFTPLREGRRDVEAGAAGLRGISIHAPT